MTLQRYGDSLTHLPAIIYSLLTIHYGATSLFFFHSSFFILIFHFSFLFLSPQPSALRLQPSDLDIRRCAGSYLKGTWVVSDRQQAYYMFVICSLFVRYFFVTSSIKNRRNIEQLSKNYRRTIEELTENYRLCLLFGGLLVLFASMF